MKTAGFFVKSQFKVFLQKFREIKECLDSSAAFLSSTKISWNHRTKSLQHWILFWKKKFMKTLHWIFFLFYLKISVKALLLISLLRKLRNFCLAVFEQKFREINFFYLSCTILISRNSFQVRLNFSFLHTFPVYVFLV